MSLQKCSADISRKRMKFLVTLRDRALMFSRFESYDTVMDLGS